MKPAMLLLILLHFWSAISTAQDKDKPKGDKNDQFQPTRDVIIIQEVVMKDKKKVGFIFFMTDENQPIKNNRLVMSPQLRGYLITIDKKRLDSQINVLENFLRQKLTTDFAESLKDHIDHSMEGLLGRDTLMKPIKSSELEQILGEGGGPPNDPNSLVSEEENKGVGEKATDGVESLLETTNGIIGALMAIAGAALVDSAATTASAAITTTIGTAATAATGGGVLTVGTAAAVSTVVIGTAASGVAGAFYLGWKLGTAVDQGLNNDNAGSGTENPMNEPKVDPRHIIKLSLASGLFKNEVKRMFNVLAIKEGSDKGVQRVRLDFQNEMKLDAMLYGSMAKANQRSIGTRKDSKGIREQKFKGLYRVQYIGYIDPPNMHKNLDKLRIDFLSATK